MKIQNIVVLDDPGIANLWPVTINHISLGTIVTVAPNSAEAEKMMEKDPHTCLVVAPGSHGQRAQFIKSMLTKHTNRVMVVSSLPLDEDSGLAFSVRPAQFILKDGEFIAFMRKVLQAFREVIPAQPHQQN